MKLQKRIEKWDKLLLECYENLLNLHKEFNEFYTELQKLENANKE